MHQMYYLINRTR